MVLKAKPTTGVHLAHCHNEFRGPRSDYVRQSIDGSQEFPNLELAPETEWNLFASPRTGCGEIPFGGVRQESSRVKKVH
ncbi:hypothetical protein TNCV_2668871 [Trichonephila clavipes]|nr:hypothetical protein TNCV_2668871 [Trichonephila clavipes]